MYRVFYNLNADPFCLDPDLDYLFLSHAHEEAVSHIAYGLQQDETVMLITGDIGTGKTLALHRVVGQLSAAFVPVVIAVTTIDFPQFMRLVMFKLGDESPPQEISSLLNAFEQKLLEARRAGRKVLLVVDEAQDCEIMLLESIRLLLNLAQPGGQVLQIVLVGQIGLEEMLSRPELRQFRQRIRVSYRLETLNRAELDAYITHRLQVAGRDNPLFEPAAVDRIFELSGGIPRLVNQFASRALLAGYVDDAARIRVKHVEEDGSESEPLPPAPPTPAAAPAAAAAPPAHATSGKAVPMSAPQPRSRSAVEPQHFADRREARRSRVWPVVVIVAVAVLAAAGTFRMWAPRLGLAGGTPETGRRPDAVVAPGLSTPDRTPAASPQAETPYADSRDTTPPDVIAPADATPEAAANNAAPQRGEPAAAPAASASSPANRPPVAEPTMAASPQPAADSRGPRAAVAADTASTGSRRSAQAPVSPGAPCSVHVFSFATEERAEASRAKFVTAGVPTFITREEGASSRLWYRVYLGPFALRARAQAVVDSLRNSGDIKYVLFTHKLPDTR